MKETVIFETGSYDVKDELQFRKELAIEEGKTIIYEDDTMFIVDEFEKWTIDDCYAIISEYEMFDYNNFFKALEAVFTDYAFLRVYSVNERWNGTYKTERDAYDVAKIRDMLRCYDDVKIMCNEQGDLVITGYHHDGEDVHLVKGLKEKYPYNSKAQKLGKKVVKAL